MHFLERDTVLNVSPERLWDFLATPSNLNELTPADLHFQVLSELPDQMYNGLTILYSIRVPLFGTRRWLTEIKHIRVGEYFVDEQRIGPYRFWYHQHILEPVGENRTRMIDRVSYQLPFGPLGLLVHEVWVKKMLDRIFNYRAARLARLFA
jgi:ligand-binding SRPBCC domain-containing protein